MIRAAVLVAAVFAAAPAFAQVDGGAPAPSPAPAPAGTAMATTNANPDVEALRRDLLEQARKEADQRVAQAKEEMRSEVRAELATQSANRSWEEEWQEQKKKLDLLELDGYLRVRPVLFQNMDLGRGPDPSGNFLYPRPYVDDNFVNSDGTPSYPSRTLVWADTRFRLEPTINVSEDIRIRTQLDIFDDMIMGSTPEIDTRYPTPFFSMNQLSPTNAINFKRAWAEVNTPVGLLSFGRMGSNWGLGMFTNDGNCLDCDYGDTVDRISFAARLGGYYIVPMFDMDGKGVLESKRYDSATYIVPSSPASQVPGVKVDPDQSDDVQGPLAGPVFTLAIAKRDTDKELQRKLDAGESSFNYGVYFSYRRQRFTWVATEPVLDAAGQPITNASTGIPETAPIAVATNASVYTPDIWGRFQTPRLRIEAEVAGVFGSIDNHNLNPGAPLSQQQSISMTQLGAVVQAEYKALENMHLHFYGEVGFASGDSAPGMGNTNVLGTTPTVPGDIDGPQYNCSTTVCSDSNINNFRFNRDYRVDLILWRELLGNVTDAIYIKPGVKYEIAEGFDVHLNIIYSRTIFAASAPGNDNNLGVEFDPGVEYRSDDGFTAAINYGLLVPLAGLQNNNIPGATTPYAGGLANAIRGTLAVKF